MVRIRSKLVAVLLMFSVGGSVVIAQDGDPSVDTFGKVRMIDEFVVGSERDDQMFGESENGVSRVEQILGRPTRVIPNTGDKAGFVSLRLGKGKGLKAGAAYVLRVEYPEDAPRTMSIHNRSAETSRALSTGPTVGDVLKARYVNSNPESVDYPLSGKIEAFEMLFYMQEKSFNLKVPRDEPIARDVTPADGVPVIISQWKAQGSPLSQGAAFSRVALYEVVEPESLPLAINYPPDGLPRRHLFWREEMSDGIVNGKDPGFKNDVDWYETKAKLMQFLGMNTFTIDMLEFGHNQGWDTSPAGPGWMNASKSPKRWQNVLNMLRDGKYPFTILPYYEYAGSVGGNSPGSKRLARPLGDEGAYTHITWSEKAYADVTEPEVLEDAKKVLDLTITRWKDVMPFTGAWFRPRPSHMPVSFSDAAIKKFSKEVKGGEPVSREELRKRGSVYSEYIKWWNGQRKAFLVALADHLRQQGTKDATILFTPDVSEPGISLSGNVLPVDDVAAWQKVIADKKIDRKPMPRQEVVKSDLYLKSLLAPHGTWGKWEWEHSVPTVDPNDYKDVADVLVTVPFNRLYTVGSPTVFDAFRNKAGLGIVRHYCLNENEMETALGYFVVDVDRTRAHQMQPEVLAMANGDPWYIGYLSGHQFNRGFPAMARRFNQAYLSLPALPSEVVVGASSDDEVVVRSIQSGAQGTWFSIANTSLNGKENLKVKLPDGATAVTDAATGKPLRAIDGSVAFKMDAAELRAIHVK